MEWDKDDDEGGGEVDEVWEAIDSAGFGLGSGVLEGEGRGSRGQ